MLLRSSLGDLLFSALANYPIWFCKILREACWFCNCCYWLCIKCCWVCICCWLQLNCINISSIDNFFSHVISSVHVLEIQVVLEAFALQIGTIPLKFWIITSAWVLCIGKWIILILVEVSIIVDWFCLQGTLIPCMAMSTMITIHYVCKMSTSLRLNFQNLLFVQCRYLYR